MARFLPGCTADGERPTGITTYVYLMMENRTYDHLLGARSLEGLPGDGQRPGFANPDRNGQSDRGVRGGRRSRQQRGVRVRHRSAARLGPRRTRPFNGGAMDGFLREHQEAHGGSLTAIEPMKYLTRAHVPVTWALADAYTSCDRWFCSVMGPTLPNRAYWHTGTSFGLDNNNAILDAFARRAGADDLQPARRARRRLGVLLRQPRRRVAARPARAVPARPRPERRHRPRPPVRRREGRRRPVLQGRRRRHAAAGRLHRSGVRHQRRSPARRTRSSARS